MLVKQCHKPSPSHHHKYVGGNPTPVMAGLWHCFTHMITQTFHGAGICYQHLYPTKLPSYVGKYRIHGAGIYANIIDGIHVTLAAPWILRVGKSTSKPPKTSEDLGLPTPYSDRGP